VPHIHLTHLVDVVDGETWAQLPDGTWAIFAVIGNALRLAEGSKAGEGLKALQGKLQARLGPPGINPFVRPSQPWQMRGRGSEIQRILQKLRGGNHCSIIGRPGSGKTLLLDVLWPLLSQEMKWSENAMLRIRFRSINSLNDLHLEVVRGLGGQRSNEWRSLLRIRPLRLLVLDDLTGMPRGERGLAMRRWLRNLADDYTVHLMITSNERLNIAFRDDNPTVDSPLHGLDPLPVDLGPLSPMVCREIVEERLLGTCWSADDFTALIDQPHQPGELLRLCAARYAELQGML
jgi:hypothetical protein